MSDYFRYPELTSEQVDEFLSPDIHNHWKASKLSVLRFSPHRNILIAVISQIAETPHVDAIETCTKISIPLKHAQMQSLLQWIKANRSKQG